MTKTVMIVDDSAVVRQVLSGLLNASPGITVSQGSSARVTGSMNAIHAKASAVDG